MYIKSERFGKESQPRQERRNNRRRFIGLVAFLVIFIIIVLVLSTLGSDFLYKQVSCDQKSTWISSLASYWGGIIGGVISGAFAFIGVFLTIRYYKESDAQKDRASVQPFLNMTVNTGANHSAVSSFMIGEPTAKKSNSCMPISVNIKNIGNGFAKTVVFYTGSNISGEAFNQVLTVNESICVELDISCGYTHSNCIKLSIQYIDSRANEYIQDYLISFDENGRLENIESGYPKLLEQ